MKYAGFWIRLVALVIDCIIIVPLNNYILSYIGDGSILRILVPNMIWWVYTAGLTSSSLQATLGKKILGLKVVDLNGNRISFGKATGRFLASILSGLILGIGYLMVAFNPKKQGLHDQIAGTYVIKNMPSSQEGPGIGLTEQGMKKVISVLFAIAGGFFFLRSVAVSFEVVRK